MATIKLGELLVKANVLTESQLKTALSEQNKWGGRLGEILVRMSLLSEDILVKALSKQLAIPAYNVDALQAVPPHVKAKIPAQMARDLAVVPVQLKDDGKTLVVAMADPQNVEDVDMLRARSNCRIVAQVAGRTAIARAISRFYEGEADISDAESSFKVVDAQGRTVVKNLADIQPSAPAAPARRATPPPAPTPSVDANAPRRNGLSEDPAELLRTVEEVQRKEVAALKAMVELLIEKGVFSRDEYLARVKR